MRLLRTFRTAIGILYGTIALQGSKLATILLISSADVSDKNRLLDCGFSKKSL